VKIKAIAIGLLLTALCGGAAAANILINAGFETGSLPPWANTTDFCEGCVWSVTTGDAHSGSHSATAAGNRLLEQTFTAVDGTWILEVSLWLRMPDSGVAAVFFGYSDDSVDDFLFEVGSDWTKFDVTSFLNTGKALVRFGVYGCGACDGSSRTFADDFLVDVDLPDQGPANEIPEPAAFLLTGAGLAALGALRRVPRR
jgi:hypothetical protein